MYITDLSYIQSGLKVLFVINRKFEKKIEDKAKKKLLFVSNDHYKELKIQIIPCGSEGTAIGHDGQSV